MNARYNASLQGRSLAARPQEAFSVPHGQAAAAQAGPLGDDSANVAALCDLVAVFLNHGLVESPPR